MYFLKDHGVPDETWHVLDFVMAVRKQTVGKPNPVLVHCSAGIGRTGTFMAIDRGMEELNSEWRVCDIFACVYRMRQQRGGCVQTAIQYRFIHQVTYSSPIVPFIQLRHCSITSHLENRAQCMAKTNPEMW